HGCLPASSSPAPDDQVDDRDDHQDDYRVVRVLEVMAPALPLASHLAAEHSERPDPHDRSERGEPEEAGKAHLRYPGRIGPREARERNHPGYHDHGVPASFEPLVRAVESPLAEVDLPAVSLEQLARAEIA